MIANVFSVKLLNYGFLTCYGGIKVKVDIFSNLNTDNNYKPFNTNVKLKNVFKY